MYKSETDNTATTPTKDCKKIYSKLLGTINPRSSMVTKWVNKPNLASKKDLTIRGKIQIGEA